MVTLHSLPYHHGGLAADTVAAGERLLRHQPHTDLTLRSLADEVSSRGIPVAHTAALAHFGSMTGIWAAIAAKGWGELSDAVALGRFDAIAAGVRYVAFALDAPNRFRLMYDSSLWQLVNRMETVHETRTLRGLPDKPVHPKALVHLSALRDSRNISFGAFVSAIVEGQARGAVRSGEPSRLARLPASLAHGLAMEFLDEGLYNHEPNVDAGREKQLAHARDLLRIAMTGMRSAVRPR